MNHNNTFRLGVLLVLVGGFHQMNIYGTVGDLGLLLVYLGGVIGVVGVIMSERSDQQ